MTLRLFTLVCFFYLLLSNERNFAQDVSSFGSQRPFAINGSVQLRGIYYTATGIPASVSPYTYLFSGSPTISIYGIAIPVSFTASSEQSSFSQPFNQFGLSPHYKWITVHVGYRSIQFSPYTLAGYNMLGAGIELTPGNFKFGFMYGRLSKATTLDTATQALVPYSFTLKAYALHIGYGNAKNYIDFSFLKAKDDDGSVPYKSYDSSYNITPAANTVFSIGFKISFLKKMFITANAAGSIYTRDINSPITLDSFNNTLFKAAKNIAIINGTSEFNTAADASIGYKAKNIGIAFQYQRIDPDFQSMGAYFFNNDLENFAIAPFLRLFKNRFRLSGSVGIEHDNVNGQKEATSHKVSANGSMGIDFNNHFGLDATYTNFSNNQQPHTIRFADSLKIAQTTQNFSISPRCIIANSKTSNTIIINASFMQLNDYNNYFAQNAISRNINFQQFFINYTLGFLPSQFSINLNISATKMDAANETDNNNGATVGLNKSFFKSALSINASCGFFVDKRNDGNNNVLNVNGNVQYRFYKKHGLTFLLYYTNSLPKNMMSATAAFTETRGELGYSYTF